MSTARAALVDTDGRVESVIVVELDGTYEPPEGLAVFVLEEGALVGIGWTLVAGEFVPPAAEPSCPPLPNILDVQGQLDDLADFIATNF